MVQKYDYGGLGIFLVEAKNTFNEMNQVIMLFTVQNVWLSGSPFVFNCYFRWSLLVFLNRNGTDSFLHSMEGVAQGDPLAMIAYGVSILPLIKNLKREIPAVTQPWYADDAGAFCTFVIIETYFNLLTNPGPGHGYYPELSKSVLIVHPDNIEAGKLFGTCRGFKVCTGVRYLGGYIGDDKSKRNWLIDRALIWEKRIGMISKTAGKHPQESYAAVARVIQSARTKKHRET